MMVSEALISSHSLFHLHSSLSPKQASPQFVIRTSIVVTPKKSTKSSLCFPSSNQTSSVVIRRCADTANPEPLRTCKNCKTQFDPSLNHPSACRFHTAHFGGETKRKFESVYSGGTMSTPDSGQVYQYWHCCGSEDPFDPGCTAAPHSSYDY